MQPPDNKDNKDTPVIHPPTDSSHLSLASVTPLSFEYSARYAPESLAALGPKKAEKLLEIQKERESLLIRINQIQGRLLSGYSKPLDQSLVLLLKQDMAFIGQITDLLVSLRP